MAIVPVRNMGQGGVILDRAPYNLPANVASSGVNIRIINGDLARLAGTTSIHTSDAAPLHIAPWLRAEGNAYVVMYDTKAELHTGLDTKTDVSPAAGFVYGGEWESTQYSQFLLLTNGRSKPQLIGPSSTNLADLPNWPEGTTCKKICAYRSFLVAIGIQKNSIDHPYMVKWSDAASPDTLSPSWDYTDPTTLAGENPLMGQDGEILTMDELGNALYLYCEYSVYRMQFIDKPYVFGFEKIFDDDGIASPKGVASYPGGHLVVGRHDIYIHNGNNKTSAGDGRIGRYFRDNCKHPESVQVFANHQYKEIWICFSSQTESTGFDKALIWNYRENVWTPVDFPTNDDGHGLYNRFAIAPEFLGITLTWDKTDDISWQWEDMQELAWSQLEPANDNFVPLVLRPDTFQILQADRGSTWDGVDYTSYVEQIKLDLDEEIGNSTTFKHLSRIYPQVSGSGELTFYAGGSDTPVLQQTWTAMNTYDIAMDYKVDAATTGRYIAIRTVMNQRGHFSLSGWDLDIRETGSR